MGEILIVEDDSDIREDVAGLLRREGYSVDTAAHGEEALNHLRSGAEHPKVIVLDVMMPVMDGWGFRYEQSADARLKHIPVIVMTGAGDGEALTESLNAVGCVTKPFPFTALLLEIQKAIGQP